MKNKPLSNDVATLQALLKQQQEQNKFFKTALDEQKEQNKSLLNQIEQLQCKFDNLLHMLYGQSSEKRSKKKPEANKETDDDSDPHPPAGENKPTKQKPKRKPLPDNLPRVREEYDIAEEDKVCIACGKPLKKISEEVQELLDCAPVQFFVRQRVHFKYACSCGKCGQKMLPFPARVIEKGMATPSLLAKIIMNKYQDALPLYHQQKRFERFGVIISRMTLCDWIRHCAHAFEPIIEKMKLDVLLRAMKIHTDDTPVFVLTIDKGKTKTGRLWVYIETCKQHAINPYDYFKDVLTRLPTQLNSKLHELLPYNWKVIPAEVL